jgi:hypothetical protein
MKKAQIYIGGVYAVKVSGNICPVKVTGESIYGGYDGMNLTTNHTVRIKSAARLRFELEKVGEKWRQKTS